MTDTIKSNSLVVAKLFVADELLAKAMLSKIIMGLIKSLNVGKTMADFQVVQTIDLILSDEVLKNFKPDDFILCFNRYKKGHYGKSYDRIDTQTILEALFQYWEEKSSVIENMSFHEHEKFKSEKIDPAEVNVEGQKKVIELMKEGLEMAKSLRPEVFKKPVDPPKELIKPENNSFHQTMLTRFDQLFFKFGSQYNGLRIVPRYGKMMSQVEFVEYKINQYRKVNNYLIRKNK